MSLTIGNLARAGGVGVETIRFYQRRGLLDQPDRAGGVRRYDARSVQRLCFIRAAQAAGFTLNEIGELLQLDAATDRARARAMALDRVAAIDAQIAALTAARDRLSRLANECGRADAGPCPILVAFD